VSALGRYIYHATVCGAYTFNVGPMERDEFLVEIDTQHGYVKAQMLSNRSRDDRELPPKAFTVRNGKLYLKVYSAEPSPLMELTFKRNKFTGVVDGTVVSLSRETVQVTDKGSRIKVMQRKETYV